MARTTKRPPFAPIAPKRVVFLAYEGHQPLDLVGPLQVFALANREGAAPGYEIIVAAMQRGRVDASAGPSLVVDHGLEALGSADTLVIPGGPGVEAAARERQLVQALRRTAGSIRRVCTVCTGSFLLAETGLLSGKRATTHWRSCADLAAKYPDIEVLSDPIFVHDGGFWTSAGVTAGIDMALALVEDDCGQAMAARVARDLVVYLRRPGGQAQFSEPLALQQRSNQGDYGKLIELVESTLNRSWSIDELAKTAGQSPRTFQRRFTEAVGRSPAVAIETLRISRARLMLETTRAPLTVVASRCGFGSQEQMRRAFHRQLGVTPGWIREHFGKLG
ncbi:GlxA family transcriptional regulator [Bradyrhizobium tropiciagri]|uniref:GlxA family transcriptional regulator n=1 Tax=Bradyrhizobium tropiciagri TaxID=312253 RepID=UPI001BA46507|nr:GlxA family transcriptional regulator [Bradyrhizobium tropiciagri]MBR0896777.1 GlxA family transcriptional regulator [Bradyrhizobium tropiciagri]